MQRTLAIAATGLMVAATLVGCSDSESGGGGADGDSQGGRVGVILPDSTVQRWAKDSTYFGEAFKTLGVSVQIDNAGGDPERFRRIGDQMIDSGVKVLVVASLDSASGKYVIDRARSEKIVTIDYDRLTVNGNADYLVGFDNERIGELQGYGLTKCLRLRNMRHPMVAELNGAPGDSNAVFLKSGYDFVLQSLYDSEEFTKGPDQFVDDWAAGPAREVFEQMLRQQPKITGVLAANDDIAGAVIAVLKKHRLNGKVPVTGEGATIGGLRNVLSGDQCLTLYKNTKSVVYIAASLVSKLLKGETPKVGDEVSDPESGRPIPFSSLPPVTIEADQVKDLVTDGTVSKADLCTGAYVTLCARYGIK